MRTPRRLTTYGTVAVTAGALVLLGVGGVAVAKIPSSKTGIITACVLKKTGAVRVINYEAGKRCRANEKRIRWDKHGAGVVRADMRFSLMWLSAGAWKNAVIRPDGSIRLSSDSSLKVSKIGTGAYCITVNNPEEGAVAALQNQAATARGPAGTIDVTMGILNPCAAVPGAQIAVRTFKFP